VSYDVASSICEAGVEAWDTDTQIFIETRLEPSFHELNGILMVLRAASARPCLQGVRVAAGFRRDAGPDTSTVLPFLSAFRLTRPTQQD